MRVLLLLIGCGSLTPAPPELPPFEAPPLSVPWTTAPADPFLAIAQPLPEASVQELRDWHAETSTTQRRLGPPAVVATLLREGQVVWNVVEITPDTLRYGGGASLSLQSGRFGAGDTRGLYVPAVHDALTQRRELGMALAREVAGLPGRRIGLRPDPGVPWGTVEAVLFTAGEAAYGAPCFVGDGPYDAAQRHCFEQIPAGTKPEPAILLRADGAWMRSAEGMAQVQDAGAVQDAPYVVLQIQDFELPVGDVARWFGMLAEAGVELTYVTTPPH